MLSSILTVSPYITWSAWALCLATISNSAGQVRAQSKGQQVPIRLASHTLDSESLEGHIDPEIATPQMVSWLEQMVRDNLPETYEDNRKWNLQKEVWDGVRVWREDNRLETKRKKKLVNSGTWTRYTITFVEPEQNLHIQFHRLEPLPDGKIAFTVTVDATLDVFGRLSQWVRDVQLISLSANADAQCRLTLEGTVAIQMNILKLPPDVMIRPEVTNARVDLTYYNVRRISQIGGEFAQALGNGLRKTLDDKIEDMNGKLAGKINAQLAKKSDRLSFSGQDWLQTKLPLPPASN